MKRYKIPAFPLLLLFLCAALAGCQTGSHAKKTWQLADSGIFSAALSSHYALIGSVGQSSASLWRLKKPKALYTWQHGQDQSKGIIAAALSGNEKFAVTADRNGLSWWKVAGGGLLGSWAFEGIRAISLSADGKAALIGLAQGAILFDLRRGVTRFRFTHRGPVTCTALSADGHLALTGGIDGEAKLWRTESGEMVRQWQHPTKVSAVALSPKGRYALTNPALGQTRLWIVKNGKLMRPLGPKVHTVLAAIFSPDGKRVALGGTTQNIDLLSVKSGRRIAHWVGKKTDYWRPSAAPVLALSFTRDGKGLLSAYSNGYAQLWKAP